MSKITITHSPRTGTLVTGTVEGDGASRVLNRRDWGPRGGIQFKFSRNLGAWYLPQSRDKLSASYRSTIVQVAAELRDAGHTVAEEIDDSDRRSVEEREAAAVKGAEGRTKRFDTYAKNAAGRSQALHAQAQQMRDSIPPGQPLMPDHSSYNADSNFRDRMHSKDEKGIEQGKKGRYWQGRELAARDFESHRFDPVVTLGRIERLTAERRRLELALEGNGFMGNDHTDTATRADWQACVDILTEEIDFWRGKIVEAEKKGFRVYTRTDFKAGDYAKVGDRWFQVLRANDKSLTLPGTLDAEIRIIRKGDGHRSLRRTVEYRKISGRMTAEEMLAQIERDATDSDHTEGPLA